MPNFVKRTLERYNTWICEAADVFSRSHYSYVHPKATSPRTRAIDIIETIHVLQNVEIPR